jgi:hypothetical protein
MGGGCIRLAALPVYEVEMRRRLWGASRLRLSGRLARVDGLLGGAVDLALRLGCDDG